VGGGNGILKPSNLGSGPAKVADYTQVNMWISVTAVMEKIGTPYDSVLIRAEGAAHSVHTRSVSEQH